MDKKFNIGDIVELKSGGPKMTINGVISYVEKKEYIYRCVWFGNESILHMGEIHQNSLKPVTA